MASNNNDGAEKPSSEAVLASLLAEIDVNNVPAPEPVSGSFCCALSDPAKQTDGYSPYMTYKVTTNTDRSEFQSPQSQVIRRYSDFTWLQQMLAEAFPGAIIPPLPKKNLAERFRDEFIKMRMRTLEAFLNKAGAHPELSTCPHFLTFLQADMMAFNQAKARAQVAKQTSRQPMTKAGIMSTLSGAFTKAKNTFTTPTRDAPKSPADVKFEEIAQYVQAIEVNMENVLKHTSLLLRKNRELANSMNEFGLAFTMLAETEAGPLGGLLNSVGGTSDSISRIMAQQAEVETIKFEEPLSSYIALVRSVRSALQTREDKKASFLVSINDLEQKRAAHGKIQGLPGREMEAAGAAHAVEMSINVAKNAKLIYEQTSARVIREVEQFKANHANQVKQLTLDYINLQIDNQTKILAKYKPLVSENPAHQISMPNPPTEAQPSTDIYPPAVHVGLLKNNSDEMKGASV